MNFFTGILSQKPIPPPTAILGVENEQLQPSIIAFLLQPEPAIISGIESNLITTKGVIVEGNNINAFTGNELSLNIQFGIVLETKVRPFLEYCAQDQSVFAYQVNATPIAYCPQDQSVFAYQINAVPIAYCPQDQGSL